MIKYNIKSSLNINTHLLLYLIKANALHCCRIYLA